MSEDIKAKIRERYRGNVNANIEVIVSLYHLSRVDTTEASP